MIRFTLGGLPVEIKAWRLAVFLAWFGSACLIFDAFVWSWWADVPVELGCAAFMEWVFPTFGLYAVLGSAVEAARELRRLRAEREAGE